MKDLKDIIKDLKEITKGYGFLSPYTKNLEAMEEELGDFNFKLKILLVGEESANKEEMIEALELQNLNHIEFEYFDIGEGSNRINKQQFESLEDKLQDKDIDMLVVCIKYGDYLDSSYPHLDDIVKEWYKQTILIKYDARKHIKGNKIQEYYAEYQFRGIYFFVADKSDEIDEEKNKQLADCFKDIDDKPREREEIKEFNFKHYLFNENLSNENAIKGKIDEILSRLEDQQQSLNFSPKDIETLEKNLNDIFDEFKAKREEFRDTQNDLREFEKKISKEFEEEIDELFDEKYRLFKEAIKNPTQENQGKIQAEFDKINGILNNKICKELKRAEEKLKDIKDVFDKDNYKAIKLTDSGKHDMNLTPVKEGIGMTANVVSAFIGTNGGDILVSGAKGVANIVSMLPIPVISQIGSAAVNMISEKEELQNKKNQRNLAFSGFAFGVGDIVVDIFGDYFAKGRVEDLKKEQKNKLQMKLKKYFEQITEDIESCNKELNNVYKKTKKAIFEKIEDKKNKSDEEKRQTREKIVKSVSEIKSLRSELKRL